jgi:hypothetical protein
MCDLLAFIGSEVAKTVIALATTAIAGGVVWLITIRNRTKKLNALLSNPNRVFILYYRGEEEKEEHKTILFQQNGRIGGKSNSNEHHWYISWGTLKIFSSGNVKFSEFKWDVKQGRLIHVNNPNLPSVMAQYIVPSFIPEGS